MSLGNEKLFSFEFENFESKRKISRFWKKRNVLIGDVIIIRTWSESCKLVVGIELNFGGERKTGIPRGRKPLKAWMCPRVPSAGPRVFKQGSYLYSVPPKIRYKFKQRSVWLSSNLEKFWTNSIRLNPK